MKKVTLYYCSIIYMLICLGCTNQPKSNPTTENLIEVTHITEDVIPEDPESIMDLPLYDDCKNYNNNLSAVARDIKFISLEMEPLVHYFHTSDIVLTDDYIFLASMRNLFQYDWDGKFIRNIGSHGQGPKEYVHLGSIEASMDKKEVYLNDINQGKILVFDFEGSFKRIFYSSAPGITLIDENLIAIPQSMGDMGLKEAPAIRFMNYQGKIIKNYPSHLHPLKEKIETFGSGLSYIWQNRNNYYYLEFGTDTIFKINGGGMEPIRHLTGKFKLEGENHFRKEKGNKLAIYSYIQRRNAAIFESEYYMIFKLTAENEEYYKVYNKATNEFHRTFYKDAERNKMSYFIDDLVSGLPFNPQYQSYEKAMSLISAPDVLEKKEEILTFIGNNPTEEGEKLKSIIETMDEEDNPLLVITTFR